MKCKHYYRWHLLTFVYLIVTFTMQTEADEEQMNNCLRHHGIETCQVAQDLPVKKMSCLLKCRSIDKGVLYRNGMINFDLAIDDIKYKTSQHLQNEIIGDYSACLSQIGPIRECMDMIEFMHCNKEAIKAYYKSKPSDLKFMKHMVVNTNWKQQPQNKPYAFKPVG